VARLPYFGMYGYILRSKFERQIKSLLSISNRILGRITGEYNVA
jgi:hypothetical protein